MTRIGLKHAVAPLGALALIAISVVFIQALRPTAKANNTAVVLEAAQPPPGNYRQYDLERSRILIISGPSGEVAAFAVPLREGKVALPDIHWWRYAYDCADFGPETRDGTITAASIFECRDSGMPDWQGISWRWSIDGQHTRGIREVEVDDFEPVKFEVNDHQIRIFREQVPGDV